MSNIRQATIVLLNLALDRKDEFNGAVEPFLKNLVDFLSEAHQKVLGDLNDGGEMRAREWAELLMPVKAFV